MKDGHYKQGGCQCRCFSQKLPSCSTFLFEKQ